MQETPWMLMEANSTDSTERTARAQNMNTKIRTVKLLEFENEFRNQERV